MLLGWFCCPLIFFCDTFLSNSFHSKCGRTRCRKRWTQRRKGMPLFDKRILKRQLIAIRRLVSLLVLLFSQFHEFPYSNIFVNLIPYILIVFFLGMDNLGQNKCFFRFTLVRKSLWTKRSVLGWNNYPKNWKIYYLSFFSCWDKIYQIKIYKIKSTKLNEIPFFQLLVTSSTLLSKMLQFQVRRNQWV